MAITASASLNQYSIGFNFGSDEPNGGNLGGLLPSDVAGVPAVAQANWNNFAGASGNVGDGITDNSGALTSVGVSWTSANTWASWGRGTEANGSNILSGTADNVLFRGYLDTGNATTTTVTVTNLPSQLTLGGYDVYVYDLSGVFVV